MLLVPDDADDKTGDTAREASESKHPESRAPDVSMLEERDTAPDLLIQMSPRMPPRKWLDGFEAAEVREGPAHQTCNVGCCASERPAHNFAKQWQSSCVGRPVTIRLGQRIMLSEQERWWVLVRCGIGETPERLGSKCALLVCGDEAREACGADQLCAGLEGGIEGGTHAAKLLWQVVKISCWWTQQMRSMKATGC